MPLDDVPYVDPQHEDSCPGCRKTAALANALVAVLRTDERGLNFDAIAGAVGSLMAFAKLEPEEVEAQLRYLVGNSRDIYEAARPYYKQQSDLHG